MAQEQRQHLDPSSRVGRSPDDTARAAHVERLHWEPRRVVRVTSVLYTAQEQQRHLDRFSRVGRSPDDTASTAAHVEHLHWEPRRVAYSAPTDANAGFKEAYF